MDKETENKIRQMTADEIYKNFNCSAFEEFEKTLTYEIKKQYGNKDESNSKQ